MRVAAAMRFAGPQKKAKTPKKGANKQASDESEAVEISDDEDDEEVVARESTSRRASAGKARKFYVDMGSSEEGASEEHVDEEEQGQDKASRQKIRTSFKANKLQGRGNSCAVSGAAATAVPATLCQDAMTAKMLCACQF